MADVEIEGRGRDKAILLLAAAQDLDLPASVVRTTTNGYIVPEEVAKALNSEPEKKAPAKKAPAKKAAAKKTTAKKAAASKATQE